MLNISKQSDVLSRLRVLQEKFVKIYDIEGLRRDVRSHEHSVRHALSIAEDLRSGMEQGMRFYTGFLDAARRTLMDVQEYASTRRLEKEALGEELRNEKARIDAMTNQMNTMQFPAQGYYHVPQYAYPSPQYGGQQAGAPPPPPPPYQQFHAYPPGR